MLEWVNPVAVTTFVATACVFATLWLWSIRSRNAAVVDLYWAPGFLVIAALSAWLAPAEVTPAGWVVFAAVALWAVRLGAHLTIRHFSSADEDALYAAFRAAAGAGWWWKSLFQVFLMQAIILWVIASPIHAVFLAPADTVVWPLVWFGLAVFAVGFALESVADWQLARFRGLAINRARTLRTGIWSWCRRPNYLGEALAWIGLGLVATAASTAWWALAGPLVLVAILVGVTSRLTEEHLRRAKRDYAAYEADVPAFLPRRPGSRNRVQAAE